MVPDRRPAHRGQAQLRRTGVRHAAADRPSRPGLLLRLIDVYQRGVEGRPSPCRFTPSCSQYAREAVEVHGRWRGSWLAVRRLVRCRPFGPSGFDPVPERKMN
ncbi:MAG: membrane protein insertion efficiency factor YidD [Ilumatobacteraceae bacterium]